MITYLKNQGLIVFTQPMKTLYTDMWRCYKEDKIVYGQSQMEVDYTCFIYVFVHCFYVFSHKVEIYGYYVDNFTLFFSK